MSRLFWTILLVVLLVPALAIAQDPEAPASKPVDPEQAAADKAAVAGADELITGVAESSTLQQLLEQVKQGWTVESAENRRRETEFRRKRNEQARLLAEAKAELVREEERSVRLEDLFEANEIRIAQLEETLKERMGNLGELFGVVRQVAGDTRGNIDGSLVSSQIPDRGEFLLELGKSKALPSIDALEKLWFALQLEMTEQGRIVKFPATVVTTEGAETAMDVVRVGAFNAVAGGKYLYWDNEVQKLKELGRQPEARFLGTVEPFESSTSGTTALAIDPSRGAILSLLVQTPSLRERIDQGGPIGYTIITLGVLAGLLGLVRFTYVVLVSRRVSSQRKNDALDEKNPLGRVLTVYEQNQQTDTETLELKLDEAILRESSDLDRYLWAIKVVSVVAPLMGLLGTVTGMIATFQAITLFGTGDPKLMAGGISEALVTTMLGLLVAIPLTLLHAGVASFSKGVLDILEEQSAGLVATRAEESGAV
ncbi:MAG: MotA/TolQ/ExbB proton channel family protein [Myxococcales bacterium]|nr:MotA/TolQ/ExbB proton channel family protein [Myxococcales bacterium]